ncbi:hypothetical protein PR048_008033 [Dryococelus australis]|uniref:Ribosomal protein L2 n=1 Tax=Dryococelus australis TaxID=614101 RepID=A0ABQ9HVY1_9NEOP|nr:hypothetical protein PR048_008033 [Dryococelus australis]
MEERKGGRRMLAVSSEIRRCQRSSLVRKLGFLRARTNFHNGPAPARTKRFFGAIKHSRGPRESVLRVHWLYPAREARGVYNSRILRRSAVPSNKISHCSNFSRGTKDAVFSTLIPQARVFFSFRGRGSQWAGKNCVAIPSRTLLREQTTCAAAAESCRSLALIGGFSRGSPASPALAFLRCYSHISLPSSALETLMLRAAQIYVHSLHCHTLSFFNIGKVWPDPNNVVSSANEDEARCIWSSARIQTQGKRDIPEKTCRQEVAFSTIPASAKSGSDPAGKRTRFAYEEGAVMVQWPDQTTRLTPRRTRLDSRRDQSPIFACGNRAERCLWSAGFLGAAPYFT